GGPDADEEAPVEAGVAGRERAVAGVVVHIHARQDGRSGAESLAVFGHQRRPDLARSMASMARARALAAAAGWSVQTPSAPLANSATSSLSRSPRQAGNDADLRSPFCSSFGRNWFSARAENEKIGSPAVCASSTSVVGAGNVAAVGAKIRSWSAPM